jgi:hypothetical protein
LSASLLLNALAPSIFQPVSVLVKEYDHNAPTTSKDIKIEFFIDGSILWVFGRIRIVDKRQQVFDWMNMIVELDLFNWHFTIFIQYLWCLGS